MATSGWQNEQTWYTHNANIRLVGNINPTSITHTGNTLRVQGIIACCARGTNGYYFYFSDYTSYAQPEGGNKLALGTKGMTWKVGTTPDQHANFDVTLSNVPATTTSKTFSVNFYGPNTNSVKATLSWTLNFDASGDPPTGPYVTLNSSTWDSVSFTSGVTDWGGLDGDNHTCIVTGSSNKAADSINSPSSLGNYGRYEYQYNGTQETAWTFTGTQSNATTTANSPIPLIGMTHYKLGYYMSNAGGTLQGIQDTLYYLPPAPSVFTYTDPGGDGSKTYPVVFTGDTGNNNSSYDTANLTRTVRYKVEGDADWTYVVNATQALIGANTSFNVTIAGGKSATIEGWMTYHGQQSAVKTLNLFNGNPPSRAYGSVGGSSKLCTKMYASVGGTSVEIVKLYASVNGQATAILG